MIVLELHAWEPEINHHSPPPPPLSLHWPEYVEWNASIPIPSSMISDSSKVTSVWCCYSDIWFIIKSPTITRAHKGIFYISLESKRSNGLFTPLSGRAPPEYTNLFICSLEVTGILIIVNTHSIAVMHCLAGLLPIGKKESLRWFYLKFLGLYIHTIYGWRRVRRIYKKEKSLFNIIFLDVWCPLSNNEKVQHIM